MSSLFSISSSSNPLLNPPQIQASIFLEVSFSEFLAQTKNVTTWVHTDEIEATDDQPIGSFDMADCMTVFGVQKKGEQITQLFAYHVADLTDEDEIIEKFDEIEIDNSQEFELFIIGSNQSIKKSGLLETLLNTFPKIFTNENHKIIQTLTNINAGSNLSYVSAVLQPNGQIIYCRHLDELAE